MEIRGQGWCNYIVQDNWSSNKIREQLRLARKVIKEPLELINKLADDQVKLKGVLSVDSKQMEVINNLGYNQDRIQMLDDQLCTTYNELDVSMKALPVEPVPAAGQRQQQQARLRNPARCGRLKKGHGVPEQSYQKRGPVRRPWEQG